MHNRRAAGMLMVAAALAAAAVHERMAAQSAPPPRGAACTPQLLGPAAVDVPSIVVRPTFLLNGQPFPGGAAGAALLTLWASDARDGFDGPQLVLGETHLAGHDVRIVPGVYDVYYSWIAGSGVPRNEATRLLQGVVLDRPRELVVDVPMISVGGLKQHNGNPFGYDGAAALSLRAVDRPGQVPLGAAQPAEFQVAIIPGTYAFEYDWQQGADFPNNRHATVRQLDLRTPVDGLVLDVPSIIQPFAFLHNGEPFPASLFERGDLVLRRGEREEAVAGGSFEGTAAIRIIPGSYDVHWRHVAGANVPRNTDARIAEGLITNGELRVIDVPSVQVSGTFLLNGQTPPSSEFENAQIRLAARNSGDTLVLGETRFGGYVRRLVPGAYDIVYEHLVGAGSLPLNPRARLERGWRIAGDAQRTIDIPVVTYSGDLAWNGGDFPSSVFSSGVIYAVPTEEGSPFFAISRTNYGGFDHPVLPGDYRAAYAHDLGSDVPQNAFTTFGRIQQITGRQAAETVLEVISGPLEVTYHHNGTPMPQGGLQNARVHLARGLNSLSLHDSIEGPRVTEAMAGRFDLFYEYRGGPDLPGNAYMRFGCWNLSR